MKTLLVLLATLLLSILLLVGGVLLLADDPAKTVESFAMRHADKLPLGWFGGRLFDQHCASCHDNPAMHAPTREALAGFGKETVMVALEFGKMQPMAAHLSKREKGLIALYLAGSGEDPSGWIEENRCPDAPSADETEFVANWGLGLSNRRFVSAAHTGINRDNVDQLELAWSLAFPRVTDMRAQPAIIGDTLYLGDKTGRLYAIDRQRGCVRAHAKVLSGIRSAITVARRSDGSRLLVFADSMASIFAFAPDDLDLVWQRDARLFDTSVITGSIAFHDGRLYVPVSSYEAAAAGSPTHICCKSHGGVIALDVDDGDRLWEWHATPPATLQGVNAAGAERYGPSGASIWSTPTIDTKRNRLYVGTGENLTHPVTDTSDAVVALDLDTGEQLWSFQATADDAWNAACLNGGANCPDNAGGDFDFGASVIQATLPDGRDLLLAGQKSGDVFALNPEADSPAERLVWRARVSHAAEGPNLAQTTTNGGIHWGMALSGNRLLVPAADPERDRPGYTPRPGLTALAVATGEELWHYSARRGCELDEANRPMVGLQNMRAGRKPSLAEQYACSFYFGFSAAATATPDLVFSGALNGVIRAFDITTGALLWESATANPFQTVNGVDGHGGAIDVDGQVIAGDWLYVQSGYSMFSQLPGNVLLAYRLPDA